MNASQPPAGRQIVDWLIGPARRALAPQDIVSGLAKQLGAAGVPLARIRIGHSVANPLIGAWGVLWTPDKGIEFYEVPRGVLATASYHGSPLEAVITTRRSFRKRLAGLDPTRDHTLLFELAEVGNTDYLALPVEYGDGSIQYAAFGSNHPGGFTDAQVELLESLASAISAAFEPAAMRHSTSSLLEVYLGSGPAAQVTQGAFHRGDVSAIDAVVLVTDMRDFTGWSERLEPNALLDRLGTYFETIVRAVRAEGGDVLKFIGDGVLSVFPQPDGRADACRRAVHAVKGAFANPVARDVPFVAALHAGPVVYGNIGSPDRLDFTVVGSTVNYASRLEGMAKLLSARAVCSFDVAAELPPEATKALGKHALKGVTEPQEIFGVVLPPE